MKTISQIIADIRELADEMDADGRYENIEYANAKGEDARRLRYYADYLEREVVPSMVYQAEVRFYGEEDWESIGLFATEEAAEARASRYREQDIRTRIRGMVVHT